MLFPSAPFLIFAVFIILLCIPFYFCLYILLFFLGLSLVPSFPFRLSAQITLFSVEWYFIISGLGIFSLPYIRGWFTEDHLCCRSITVHKCFPPFLFLSYTQVHVLPAVTVFYGHTTLFELPDPFFSSQYTETKDHPTSFWSLGGFFFFYHLLCSKRE